MGRSWKDEGQDKITILGGIVMFCSGNENKPKPKGDFSLFLKRMRW
jgi:hypothetical protein